MTSACWCQSPKSHRADFIRWSGKPHCSCFQCGSLTSYATPYFVSYLRFVRPFHVQALVMGRNIAKSVAQMSHCPKYSPESVFPEVTAAIVDAIALHSAVDSGCRGAISQPAPSSQPNLDPGSSPHLMSPGALQYIVNPRCFISSSHSSLQLSLHVLIILPVYHGDHSNLCYCRRRRLPPFDVHKRFSIHPASSPIAQYYHIQVSHLSIGRATSSSSGAVESRRRSASALVYLTQRLLRHLSRDFLRRSGRQSRDSFDNQYSAAFLWSSPELLSRFVGSVAVQLPTDPPLRGDNVFRIRRAAHIRRCPSRPYVLFTRAREPLFAHRKSHGHFRQHFIHRLAGHVYSQLPNGTLITFHPQAFVRILPP